MVILQIYGNELFLCVPYLTFLPLLKVSLRNQVILNISESLLLRIWIKILVTKPHLEKVVVLYKME